MFASGEVKATNDLRALMRCFVSGSVPASWLAMYVGKSTISLGQWMGDFIARVRALNRYLPALPANIVPASRGAGAGGADGNNVVYWMGGMFMPETYIMATRQQTAQVHGWSLDDMELFLDIKPASSDGSVEGLVLEGATISTTYLDLSEELRQAMPVCSLQWRPRHDAGAQAQLAGVYHILPLYLNDSRVQLLAEVRVLVASQVPAHVWSQRGVAVLIQHMDA
jgi:hypothetical protein